MANPNWMYVERVGGRVCRVTVLDDELRVIATHDRDGRRPSELFEPDDCQLLRAVELERRVGLSPAG